MNKDDDLNSEKMVEKCCSCVGWGLRSGTTKRWARPTLTLSHSVSAGTGVQTPQSPIQTKGYLVTSPLKSNRGEEHFASKQMDATAAQVPQSGGDKELAL